MTKRGKSELLWRILVAHNIIEMLEDTDDPRKDDAIAHYMEQAAKLERELAELENTPPDVIIGLKAARLTTKTDKEK